MLFPRFKLFATAILLACLPTTTFAVSLIDALVTNDATQFALLLESNPALLAFYLSPSVKTVFAPIDGSTSNDTGIVRRDSTGATDAQSSYQTSSTEQVMSDDRPAKRKRSVKLVGDKTVETNLDDFKLFPNNQSVVAELALSSNNSTSGIKFRRGLGPSSHLSYSAPEWSSASYAVPPSQSHSVLQKYSSPDAEPCTTSSTWKPPVSPPPPPPPPTTKTSTETSTECPPTPPPAPSTKTTIENYPPPPPTPSTKTCTESYPPPPPPTPSTKTTTKIVTTSLLPPPPPPPPSTKTTTKIITTSLLPPPPPPLPTPSTKTTTTIIATLSLTTTVISIKESSPTEQTTFVSATPNPPGTSPSPAPTGTIPNPPIKLASGLGNRVNLLKADIPYDGGLLQITDGFFTIPETVSQTLAYTNLTDFLDLLNQANLTAVVDNMHRITIFVPSNAAIAAVSSSYSTPSQIQTFIYSHIVPNFLGYLPQLTNGLTLHTLANTTLTVTIVDNIYYINGAQIIDPDVLTDNGVIDVIDKVLTTPTVTFSGGSTSSKQGLTFTTILGMITFAFWML